MPTLCPPCALPLRFFVQRALPLTMAESIYNLIPQPIMPATKGPLYRSKVPGDMPATFSTFGLAGTSKPGYSNVSGAYEVRARQGSAGAPAGWSLHDGLPVHACGRAAHRRAAHAHPRNLPQVASGPHTYKKSHATFGKHDNAIPPTQVLRKGTGMGGGAVELSMKVDKFTYPDGERKAAVPSQKESETYYKNSLKQRETKVRGAAAARASPAASCEAAAARRAPPVSGDATCPVRPRRMHAPPCTLPPVHTAPACAPPRAQQPERRRPVRTSELHHRKRRREHPLSTEARARADRLDEEARLWQGA